MAAKVKGVNGKNVPEIVLDQTDVDTDDDGKDNHSQQSSESQGKIYFKEFNDNNVDCKDRGCICSLMNTIYEILAQLFTFCVMICIFLPILILIYIWCLITGIISLYCCCCIKNNYSRFIKNQIIRYGSFRYWMTNRIMRTCYPFWYIFMNTPIIKNYSNILLISVLLKMYISKIGTMPKMNLDNDFENYDTAEDCGKKTYARHLGKSHKYTQSLPDINKVVELFIRPKKKDGFIREINRNSSLMLPYFAQWLTHQFFNTNLNKHTVSDSSDYKINWTNQPIAFNLSQLYGSVPEVTYRFRAKKGMYVS